MKELLISTFRDLFIPVKFLKNKWHLHLPIGGVLGILIFILLNTTFDETPIWFRIFVVNFVVLGLSFAWEWFQGAFYGANKTKNEVFESRKDIIVSLLGGLIGSLIYYICFLN